MKSQDILILLKLVSLQQNDTPDLLKEQTSVRALEVALGVSKTEIHAAINRCINSGLAIKDRKLAYPKANMQALLAFICHGIKYVFPIQAGAMVRGIATTFDAPVLQDQLISVNTIKHVWPYAAGTELGQSIPPLFKSVPLAALQDARLYRYLALVDAIRLGQAREANLAQQLLTQAFKQ